MSDERQHPHDLLADYVDGTLAGNDLAAVESHLTACAECRAEVALASRALIALEVLPEVEAPSGLDLAVRREVRRRPRRAGRAWRVAGAAAVAAGVLAGAVVVGRALLTGGMDQGGQGLAGAPAEGEAREEQAGPQAPQPAAGDAVEQEQDRALSAFAAAGQEGTVRYSVSQTDHTAPSLVALGRRLADAGRAAVEAGFPPTAEAFFEGFEIQALPPDLRRSAVCVLEEVPPEQPVVPFLIQEARFQGDPVYVAAFLQGPGFDAPYDRMLIWVVHRETCALRYYASHRL